MLLWNGPREPSCVTQAQRRGREVAPARLGAATHRERCGREGDEGFWPLALAPCQLGLDVRRGVAPVGAQTHWCSTHGWT